ncbi:MAG: DUF951 domain-containing protein [Dehalococcoidia bacterium]
MPPEDSGAPDPLVPLDPMDLRMGDVLRLRKPHPCGGTDWEVVRLGGEIGLRCLGCQRRIILDRPTLRRRTKAVVERGTPLDPAVERALYGGAAGDGAPSDG